MMYLPSGAYYLMITCFVVGFLSFIGWVGFGLYELVKWLF